MKLSRYFRKYSRTLLMVFMALLLVSFLVGDVIQSFSRRMQQANYKIGTAFGEPLYSTDVDRVRSELDVLTMLGLKPPTVREQVIDIYLLMEEAARSGIRVGEEQVKAELVNGGVTDDVLLEVQKRTRLSYGGIYQIVGRWISVLRFMQLERNGVVPSLPRMEAAFRDEQQDAVVNACILDANAFLPQIGEPTPEQIQAFFDECKARDTRSSENKLEFGYLQPDRVRLEYLTVDPARIEAEIQIKETQVRRFFEENQSRYTKPGVSPLEDPNAPSPPVPLTYEEARDRVRADFRRERAIEDASRKVNEIQAEARRPWQGSPRGDDGFLAAPAELGPSFEELATRFSTTCPVEFHRTELLSRSELESLPGVSRAVETDTRQRLSVAALAFRVKGILTTTKDDQLPTLNLNEPAPVVMASEVDLSLGKQRPTRAYLFRVVEVVPSAPPASPAEVGDKLLEDWKKVQAFDRAGEAAAKLAQAARSAGLTAAAEQATELLESLKKADPPTTMPTTTQPVYSRGLEVVTSTRFGRRGGFLPDKTRNSSLYAMAVAKELYALADAPPTDTAPAHTVAAVPMATRMVWVVAEMAELKPIYEGVFETQIDRLAADRSDLQVFQMGWLLDSDKIYKRCNYVPATGLRPE